MEIGSSFCLGAFLKVVDDVLDNDIQVDPFFLELFKTLTIVFLTALAIQDFPFALSTTLSLGLSYLAGGLDNDYWWAFLGCSVLLTLLSFRKLYLIPWLLPVVWIIPLSVYGEALIFPENSSFEKMLGSAAMIPILAFLYNLPIIPFIKSVFPFSGIAEKGIFFGIGYFFIRTLIQVYIYFQEKFNTPSILDSSSLNDEHIDISNLDTVSLKSSENLSDTT